MAKVKNKPIDTKTKDITNWDAELAAAAEEAAKRAGEVAGSGTRKITIRGGQMSIDDNPVPGNTLVGVVCAFVAHNKYFTEDYDPDQSISPACYAYGEHVDEMGPHDDAEDKQSERCKGCPQNEFGTSNKGRGKACKNTFQLLLLPVGTYDHKQDSFEAPEDTSEIEDAEAYALSVPPTSLKAWAGYQKKLAGNLRPAWSSYTKITVSPDPKTQWKMGFELVGNAETSLLLALRTRHEEGQKLIVQPYPKNSEREEPAKKRPGKKRY